VLIVLKSGASNSWYPQGLSRPVMGLLYLLFAVVYMGRVTMALYMVLESQEINFCMFSITAIGSPFLCGNFFAKIVPVPTAFLRVQLVQIPLAIFRNTV
jgi:hypothetical protein